MQLQHIDLYAYFNLPRPEGGAGFLSCYLPEDIGLGERRRQRPGVLVIPGGGYSHVSPREGEPIALRFLTRGYATFVLEYSVAPLRFPHPLREAAMAMAYIRQNAKDFGIGQIAAIGFSAGGHLCGMLSTLFDAPEISDIAPANLVRPDAVCLCYPVAVSWGKTHERSFHNLCGDDDALWQRLSLDRCVRADMPPCFLWHTRDDATVPCRNSLILAQAMEQLDLPFELHLYRSGQHGLSTADDQAYAASAVPKVSAGVPGWLDACMDFFREMGLCVRDGEKAV